MSDDGTPEGQSGRSDSSGGSGIEPPPAEPAAPDRAKLRRGVALVVLIGGAAAVALGVATVDARTLAAAASAPRAIALSLGFVLVAWLAEGLVFGALSGRLAPRDLPRMVRVYLGASFPSAVTPFASGAIPAWTWLLAREGVPGGEAAAVVGLRSVVTSAFFGLAALAAAAALPALLGPRWAGAILGLVAVLLVSIALLAAVAVRPEAVAELLRRLSRSRLARRVGGAARLERVERRLTGETASFAATLRRTVRAHPGRLLLALLATCASRALLFSVPWVLLRGFGQRAEWLPLVLGMLAVQALGSATPSPGGSGVSEAALAGLLHGRTESYVIGAVVVLWRLLTFWLEMAVGAVIFSRALARPR